MVPILIAILAVLAGSGCSSGGAGASPDGATGSGGSGGSTGSGGNTTGSGGGGGGSAGSGGQNTMTDGGGGTSDGNVAMDSAPDGSGDGSGSNDAAGDKAIPAGKFSFFLTSLDAMRRLSKSQNGFGGDLRYGQADGLAGADKICTDIADFVVPGAGAKQWRAFLSTVAGPVHAIDRIGNGPWYDRTERLVAMTKADLLQPRPRGASAAIINDLPNEYGVPNHRPDPAVPEVDNHHVLTGSTEMGRLYTAAGPDSTCKNWTSAARDSTSRPRIGFSWPEANRINWISGQDEGGCGAGVNVVQTGGSDPNNPIVGSGGGYGAIYCFALMP
ncbi:MAG: hypothetical protein QOI66_1668 [Myxococcales bacterium]|nr:hypothetical protein [Myxococcales bacterium]